MNFDEPRRLEPEILDGLAAADPRAQRSRTDLRRIHRAMGTLSIMQRALDRSTASRRPHRLLEIGAGDGTLMLRLAQRQAVRWPALSVTLLDRVETVERQTLDGFVRLGWNPSMVTMDLFDWLKNVEDQRWDVVCASLFLHHLSSIELRRLLSYVASATDVFFCCEPRRSSLALLGSHLVGLLGAGPVTRADAVASVHAGFSGLELTALWPNHTQWQLEEHAAGLFSHAFLAVRNQA